MFNFSITKKEEVKSNILYIDNDEKYHFIITEILNNYASVTVAKSVEDAIEVFNKESHWDLVFLCVDNIDHARIMNASTLENSNYPEIILVTSHLDAIHLYELVAVYGAQDYITKPFSNKRIIEFVEFLNQKNKPRNIYKERLMQDIHFFNDTIHSLSEHYQTQMPVLAFESLDVHIEKLLDVRQKLESLNPFSKIQRPNILFIDDEKNIIDVYQQFVKDKPFNPFFSGSLKESRQVLEEKDIELIILDLGLPDGHGIGLLKEIYSKDPLDTSLPDVIVISSYYEKTTVIEVINAGAKIFINKPMTYKKFISVINQLTFLRFMRKELALKKLEMKSNYVM
ncbi:MAG: response regulator [Candidatus Marinamargulisbacteria bacterium]